MEIDLFNNPLDFILNKHFNHTIFFWKMKSLNKEFLNLFDKNDIKIDKRKLEIIFELKDNNDQLIDLNDCLLKINKKIRKIITKKIIDNLKKKNIDLERDKL